MITNPCNVIILLFREAVKVIVGKINDQKPFVNVCGVGVIGTVGGGGRAAGAAGAA